MLDKEKFVKWAENKLINFPNYSWETPLRIIIQEMNNGNFDVKEENKNDLRKMIIALEALHSPEIDNLIQKVESLEKVIKYHDKEIEFLNRMVVSSKKEAKYD